MIRRHKRVDGRGRWGRAETRLQPAQGPLARALHRNGVGDSRADRLATNDTGSRAQATRGEAGERTAEADSQSAATEIAAKTARLEAVLLLAREPLPSRKLAQLAELADGTEARTLVRRLNTAYDGRRCAFRVEQSAGGYQLLTRAQFAPWLRRLHSKRMEVRLSSPALETLAVVAYRQPVVRAEIEAVRGVQCGEMLRQLMERDLVRIAGKSQELGRPFVYATTRKFLQVFGLRDLDDLPRADLLRKRTSEAADGSETAGPVDVAMGNDGNDENSLLPKESPVTLAMARPEMVDEEEDLLAALRPIAPVVASDDDDDYEDEDEEEDDEEDDEEEEEWEEVEDDEEGDEEEEEWDEEDEEWDEEDDEEWDEEEDEDEEEWDDEE